MFEKSVIDAWKAHARRCFPRECAGVVARVNGAARYVEIEALRSDQDHVRFREDDVLGYGGDLLALCHSHTHVDPAAVYPNFPSRQDMEAQIAWDRPCGLLVAGRDHVSEPRWWGDGTPRPPILKRGFWWVFEDCYELIRDVYREQRGIRLKQFAREWGAWKPSAVHPHGFSGYVEHYRAGGFVEVEKPQAWDLGVMRAGFGEAHRNPLCHAGVVLPNGEFLHHRGHATRPVAPEMLSHTDPLVYWSRRVSQGGMWLRYVG